MHRLALAFDAGVDTGAGAADDAAAGPAAESRRVGLRWLHFSPSLSDVGMAQPSRANDAFRLVYRSSIGLRSCHGRTRTEG